jgi:hypothetical protein
MLPLIELLMNANGGNAMNQMAAQFGLSPEQVQAATEALLPAFSMGLQRNTADPMGMGSFLSALASGGHAKYFDNVANAFNPAGQQDGNAILGHLFGSKDVSRAVAAQAAQATGIGQDILKQMLPVLATTLMGGMFKQSSGAMPAAGMGAGDNIFGKVIEEMMRQSGGQRQAPQEQATPVDPMADNPLGKILEGMFGGGQAAPQQRQQNPMGDNPLGQILEQLTKGAQSRSAPQQQNPMGDNPLGKILEGMFGGGQAQQQEEEQPEPQRQTRRQPQNPMGDALNDMFKTGRQTQETYNKGLEDIFDGFLKGMDRSR